MNDHNPTVWKRIPEVAEQRQKLAAAYRSARKQNPAIARLVRKRVNAVADREADRIIEELFV